MLAACASLGLPLLLGVLTVDRVLGRTGLGLARNPCLVLGAGILIGLGVTSVLDYALLLAFAGRRAPFLIVDTAALLLATALLWWCRGPRPATPSEPRPAGTLVVGLLAVVMAVAAFAFFQQLLAHPFGRWDAWAMWNMKARFIALGGTEWATFLSPEMARTHPDYPLLLPLSVARGWMYARDTSLVVPMSVAAAYAVALVLVLFGALLQLRDALTAAIGTLLLLAAPPVIVIAAAQYADVPLAAYLTASVAFLLCGRTASSERAAHASFLLAGMLAGLAAWTKNEGLLYALVAAIVPVGLALARSERLLGVTTRLVAYTLGALPALVVVLLFKSSVSTRNDLLEGQHAGVTLTRLLDLERHLAVATSMGETLLWFGDGASLALVVVAVACAVLAPRGPTTAEGRLAIAVSLAMLGGYYLAFVTTPQALDWHLRTADVRVVLQVWPTLVLAALLAYRPAHTAWTATSTPGR